MTFIKTVPEDQAEARVVEQYEADLKSKGYIANSTKAFSLRPEVYDAWGKLLGSIRSNMRLRRYELVTLAAAMAIRCTY